MNDIILQLIISGAGIILAIVAVIGILAKKLGGNPGNGCAKLDKEFTAQVGKCTERFMEMAEERGEVKTSLQNIESDIADIKKKVSRRR
ncbi:MAG: hypothetical protein MUP81_06485 [Dehalococcoidia bacterium]|nr:hypothetical protein [Dehalococcoidia bacterium]